MITAIFATNTDITMRKKRKISSLFLVLFFLSISPFASALTPQPQFFGQSIVVKPSVPKSKKIKHIVHRPNGTFMVDGSLKANIFRLAKQYHWPRVVWNSDVDYHWVGNVQILNQDLPSIFRQILQNYPLQAVFYEGNHVIVINPRTLL